ncbi:gp53-like domain-containing protein [Enterobacter asburiae]|uniref:gp53-like domain-containing protein n=1 Tax=Enterobacter asburiae TaxID=61645 RepID=UPI0018681B99|nr:hypothetical protein [Enterobacter asburiae]BDS25814.1 hypothetical protein KAM576c_24330 [Enterobacter asburiae]HCR1893167.1 hypothetical protein [Enterobacter asburiae]
MRPLMPPVQTPDNLFHDGNPLTGELGTIVDAEHLNNEQAAIRDTQSELIAILTAAAMEPESTAGQLLAALNKLYAPLNDTLGALSSLVGGANKLPYFTSANAAALTALSSIGRDIVGKATVADVLTYLGLGTAATKNVGTGTGQIPDMSSFTNSSGWQKLPGGKILQWGKAGFPVGQTQISVPFPINFPSVVSNIQLTFADINFSGGTPTPTLAVVNNTVNGAGFGAYMSGAGGFNAYFFAIGS